MKVEETEFEGLKIVTPTSYHDNRGHFLETFNMKEFRDKVGNYDFVQDNESTSHECVLRGLHYQMGVFAQAKLVKVTRGMVLDVVVDVRPKSSTFGRHFSIILDSENKKQLMIPRGFAHGFLALSPDVIFSYKCDNYYYSPSEKGILYNDPTIGIAWGAEFGIAEEGYIVSEKDLALPNFRDITSF